MDYPVYEGSSMKKTYKNLITAAALAVLAAALARPLQADIAVSNTPPSNPTSVNCYSA